MTDTLDERPAAAWAEGQGHLQAGRLTEAATAFQDAASAAQSADEPIAEASARGALADVLLGLGRWTEARQAALRAHELAVAVGDRAAADHFAGVVAHSDVFSRLYPDGGPVDPTAHPRLEAALAAYRATHDPAEEETHLLTAIEAAVAGRLPGEEAGLQAGLAERLKRRGADARPALERALTIARALGQEAAEDHFAARLAEVG